MRLMVASILLPFTAVARHRDILCANQFGPNPFSTPFGTGSFFSLTRLRNEDGHHRSSARHTSDAIALCRTLGPVLSDQQICSKTTVEIHHRAPALANNPTREECYG